MKTHVNLLPIDHLRREMIYRRLCQWTIVWGGVLAFAFAIGGSRHAHNAQLEKRRQALATESEPVKRLQTELSLLQNRLRNLKKREAIMLSLTTERPVLAILGVVSAAAKRCEGAVALDQMLVSENTVRQGARLPANSTNTVTLEGIADDDAAISRFADALRTSDLFKQVSLKNTENHEISTVIMRRFNVECCY